MLGALVVLMASCNNNLDVAITPDIPQPTVTIYNMAEGIYNGDILGNGSAFFRLDLAHSSDPNTGILIMGFCTVPSSSSDFNLETGTYNIGSTGAIKTVYPGMIEGGIQIGTYRYNKTMDKITWISGGTMTIEQSGETYTIKGDFAGVDANTGNAENNIHFSYTGIIDFVDSPDYKNIVNCSYVATGTPSYANTPGPNTWTGTLEVIEDGNGIKYKINNWANREIYHVMCFLKNGKIFLDNNTRDRKSVV